LPQGWPAGLPLTEGIPENGMRAHRPGSDLFAARRASALHCQRRTKTHKDTDNLLVTVG
jgi:hypothetical protein